MDADNTKSLPPGRPDRPFRFDVLTLFPGLFEGFLGESLVGKAIQRELLQIHCWDFRDWTTDKHRRVDDRPFGGGPGMVIMPQPVFDAVEAVQQQGDQPGQLLMMSPRGQRLTQQLAEELSQEQRLIILCGRYEGFDERVHQGLAPREISIGDFICNGGEVPAMIVIETIMRLLPGVLGDPQSVVEESFSQPGWIEYPQYTRPTEYRGMKVPDILFTGHHANIAKWRADQASHRPVQQPSDNTK